jgi:hypothetical protein
MAQNRVTSVCRPPANRFDCRASLVLICSGESRQLLIHIKGPWDFFLLWLLSSATCRPYGGCHTAGVASPQGDRELSLSSVLSSLASKGSSFGHKTNFPFHGAGEDLLCFASSQLHFHPTCRSSVVVTAFLHGLQLLFFRRLGLRGSLQGGPLMCAAIWLLSVSDP